MSPLELALSYIARGWSPVPIPFRSKAPSGDNWQSLTITAETAPRHFNGGALNIGVLLGDASHGLTDVDLDCAEAIAIAPYILPQTGAIFGRASKRNSHWLYITNLAATTDAAALQLRDPRSKSMTLELRIGGGGKAAQTVFPGSVHQDGESISWEENGKPASVDGEDLRQQIRAVAAYAVLARYWPSKGSRHEAARIVGGLLSRHGIKPEQIGVIAEAVARAANDDEWRDRRDTARDAAVAHGNGKNTYGLNALRDMFGTDIADKVAEWLGYGEDQQSFAYEAERPADQGAADARGDAPASGTPSAPWVWLDMSQWDNEPVPERQWAIYNRSPLNQAGLFSGHGGTGKSILELMKNVAHVAGRDWLGSMPEIGPAFYIGSEDETDEIHRRLAAITAHYGVTFKQLTDDGLYAHCLIGKDATLCAASPKSGKVEVTSLYRDLYQMAGDIRPKNITVDTLSRAFAGNEMDRVQVYAFANHMQALAMVGGGSVTVLSHPSLAGMTTGSGISGSTAWHNAFRFRHYLKGVKAEDGEPPDNDLRELEFLKNQYGSLGERIILRYQDGLFLPVPGMTSLDRAEREAKVDGVFLQGLQQLTQQGRDAMAGATSPEFGPTLIADLPLAKKERVHKRELVEAVTRLLNANKVHIERTSGSPSHAKKYLRSGPAAAVANDGQ